eukprot:scaffold21005_cov30-Tisochrysis_lutea.AAC.3
MQSRATSLDSLLGEDKTLGDFIPDEKQRGEADIVQARLGSLAAPAQLRLAARWRGARCTSRSVTRPSFARRT